MPESKSENNSVKNLENCIFCKIAHQKIKTELLYEDEKIMAFRDISPKAPVHFLVVPKEHIESLLAVEADNASHQELLGYLNMKLVELAKAEGLHQGFKVAVNTGKAGGQEVMHLHYHVTGKRE
jgi:histidine triad (HIT) family protein